MKSLDIFVNSCNNENYTNIKSCFKKAKKATTPLISWDIHQTQHYKKLSFFTKENDFNELKFYIDKYQWNNDLKHLINSYNYDALVVTDLQKKIIWVNKGFSKMTGYSRNRAISKDPSFLQGELTDNNVRKRISKKIQLEKPFKETIINYKQDKSTYKCELYIIPLKNNLNTTHFIALEKSI